MDCIANCVRNTAGAENFEKNRADRQDKLQSYLKKKSLYDAKEMQLDVEYGELLNKQADLNSQDASLKFVMQSLQEMASDTQLKNNTSKTLDYLLKLEC